MCRSQLIKRFFSWSATAALICVPVANGAVYYISPSGNNISNAGTSTSAPFQTIQKAADVMQAGDTCYIRNGVYREFVQPPRGGSDEAHRIVYKAYPGELPSLRGSERITGWVQQGGGNVWKADVADVTFGSFNPFTIKHADFAATGYANQWMDNYTRLFHVGEVYYKGQAFRERLSQNAVTDSVQSWYTTHNGTTTTIYANFGNGSNPNSDTTEINVRKAIIYPSVKEQVKYITIDGLELKQAATTWNENVGQQSGIIGTRFGTYWIIQNCRISYSKTTGITCGQPDGGTSDKYSSNIAICGHHIIRNNLIEKCGEQGICANGGGLAASLIEGNLIQDINYQGLIGGQESGCIKAHWAVDLIIKNNIFRRIQSFRRGGTTVAGTGTDGGTFPAIWIDWAAMGVRISGNVFTDVDRNNIYMEANHGPFLIDNNIFFGERIYNHSERVVTVHNLFLKAGFSYQGVDDTRSAEYYQPHTFTRAGSGNMKYIGFRTYNNIFSSIYNSPTTASSGPWTGSTVTDCIWDYNLFYKNNKCGTHPTEGSHSVVDATLEPNSGYQDLENGVVIGFDMNTKPKEMNCPLITRSFIGVFSSVNMGIENPDGSAISVDKDMLGNNRNTTNPTAGPIENILNGSNTITITAGPVKTAGKAVYSQPDWNIAPQALASSSGGNGAENVNDRLTAETCKGSYFCSSPYPKYVTLNWRFPQAFDKVRFVGMGSTSPGTISVDVEASEDGSTNWATAGSFSSLTWQSAWVQFATVTFPQVTNKKGIRFKLNGGSGSINLGEIEVFNTSGGYGSTGTVRPDSRSVLKNTLPGSSKVMVYDTKGRLVSSHLKNSAAGPVLQKNAVRSQGMYMVVREAQGQRAVEKVVVSR